MTKHLKIKNKDTRESRFHFKRRWKALTVALSVCVAVGTTAALMLPAITMSEPPCELEEHTHSLEQGCYSTGMKTSLNCNYETLGVHRHTPDCFDVEQNELCGYSDKLLHTHDSFCFDENGELICSLPEIKEHRHSDECGSVTETVVEEGHAHEDSCWEWVTSAEPTCGIEESDGHTHSEGCVATGSELKCTVTDDPEHQHEDVCYYAAGEIICSLEETSGHQHDESCFGLVKSGLICAEEEREPVIEIGELELTCGEEEIIFHVHIQEECFFYDEEREEEILICTETVVESHQHNEACFTETEATVLICERPEHTHTSECVLPTECTCGTDNEAHAEDCPLYVLPGCICGSNDTRHSVDCPLYYPHDMVSYIPAVNFTNVAPLMTNFPRARMMDLTSSNGDVVDVPVVLNKSVTKTPDEDENYTLTLESYATGRTVTTQTYVEKPVDMVLVLDMSTSMVCCTECSQFLYPGDERSDHADPGLLYGARYCGTSDETFSAHKSIVSAIKRDQWNYRVDTSKIDFQSAYYVRSEENGVDVFRRVYYCQKCSREALDSHDDYAERGRWHWLDHMNDHKEKCLPAQDGEEKGYYFFYPVELLIDEKCTSRYRMMYEALHLFVDDVVSRSKGADGIPGTADDVAHKIGFVAFDGEHGPNGACEVAPLTSVLSTTTGGIDPALQAAMEYYNFGSTTPTGYGLQAGVKMITTSEQTDARSRMIILLTDGVPNPGSVYEQVDLALKASYDAIANQNATVYTIGIFNGANGSNPGSIADYNLANLAESLSEQKHWDQANSFMHLLSSNYPYIRNSSDWQSRNTAAMTLNPQLTEGKSYYLSAADLTGMKDIFQQIAAGMSSDTVASELDETTVMKDVVTRYFDVASDSEITAYTMTYGKDDSGNDIWTKDDASVSTLNVSGGAMSMQGELVINMEVNEDATTTVNVTNFDFGENYVGLDEYVDGGVTTYTPHGKKLVLEIEIKRKPDFIGGNQVPTNTGDSGIYDGGGAVLDTFPMPDVDVTLLTPAITIPDLYLYLGSNLAEELQIQNLWDTSLLDDPLSVVIDTIGNAEDLTLDLNRPDNEYGIDWQDDYAKLSLQFLDKYENVVESLKDIRDDQTYYVRLIVTPVCEGSIRAATTPSDNGDITVFYPTLFFHDDTYPYGVPLPNSEQMANRNWDKDRLVWRDSNGMDSTVVTMTSKAVPAIELICTPDYNEATMPNHNVPVNVTVGKVGYVDDDVQGRCTFDWNACDPDCGVNLVSHNGETNSYEFYLHTQYTVALPETGGAGTFPYILSGWAIIAVASMLLYKHNRTKRKEDETM